MPNELSGRRAIITGGGGGIGFASARLLARDGALVTIVGRTEARLRDVAEPPRRRRPGVEWFVADAIDPAAVRAAVEAAADDQGGLHIAVLSRASGLFRPILLYGDDQFDENIRANVRPTFLLLKYAGRAHGQGGRRLVRGDLHARRLDVHPVPLVLRRRQGRRRPARSHRRRRTRSLTTSA